MLSHSAISIQLNILLRIKRIKLQKVKWGIKRCNLQISNHSWPENETPIYLRYQEKSWSTAIWPYSGRIFNGLQEIRTIELYLLNFK